MPACTKAFCPGHLSGYFRPVYSTDPRTTGSMGAGIVIREGVTARVCAADRTSVMVQRRDSSGSLLEEYRSSPPLEYMLERMGVTARVETVCRLPIGAGFGLSAAALLSSAVAVNAHFCLSLRPEECTMFAHQAEIVHRTGLGDVAACQGGGWDCRRSPGIPGEISRVFDPDTPVYAVVFGPLSSPVVLGSPEAMERVIRAFPGRCPEDTRDFFLLSREFSEKSGLITPQVRSALSLCDAERIPATMTMLGNGVFACGEEASPLLAPLGEVFRLEGAVRGVELLEGPE